MPPLSRCRFCGKRVPNIFRPYHEQVQCVQARKMRGEYVSPEARKRQLKREIEKRKREAEEAQARPQKRLEIFLVQAVEAGK